MVHNIDDSPDLQINMHNLAGVATGSDLRDGGSVKEQEQLLPIANVGRIMKQMLPPNAKISKEAKQTMQECVSEFISFVTGEASDKCHKEKRKTVNGDDVCWALGTLGFDDYTDPLKRYLHKYREYEGEKANQSKASSSIDKGEPSICSSDQPKIELNSAPNALNSNAMERK
ncbi:Nuclear transcription factor y subunit b [Thalictrum thalictroides]|uniref:Nuclear transcription factor y subunit b n=1 Tax=Thalictrum thalictroides TaxID=46969 RepID=A0A7J6XEE5_THATH|nr:Nuclear transcription factor y subunit b [Thalictrum thalictroides]